MLFKKKYFKSMSELEAENGKPEVIVFPTTKQARGWAPSHEPLIRKVQLKIDEANKEGKWCATITDLITPNYVLNLVVLLRDAGLTAYPDIDEKTTLHVEWEPSEGEDDDDEEWW